MPFGARRDENWKIGKVERVELIRTRVEPMHAPMIKCFLNII